MNDLVRPPQQKLAVRDAGVPVALIVALNGEFAKEVATDVWRIGCTVQDWDYDRKTARQEEEDRRSNLRAVIDRGEAILADARYRELAAELEPYIGTATLAQITHEITKLLAAFPTKDDLTAFTAILIEEVLDEKPSRLALAGACRRLRRKSNFRPSIANVLKKLGDAHWYADRSAKIVELPKYVAALKQRLADGERQLIVDSITDIKEG